MAAIKYSFKGLLREEVESPFLEVFKKHIVSVVLRDIV